MGSLIAFELKKIAARRVTQVSLVIILVMLFVVTWWNITSTYALDPNEFDNELEGTAAIAQIKANANALAGPITDEKATEALREYKSFVDPDVGEVKDEFRADLPTPGKRAEEYWKFNATHSAYMSLITRPWMNGFQMPVSVAGTIDTSETVDLYGQIRTKITSQLEDTGGAFSFTEEERGFWLDKADEVATPVEYGYSGGWKDFIAMAQFLIFALIAVVIACASVFNAEYREKTDAVLLSTKYGKAQLSWAKVIAATIAASAIYWLMCLLMLLMVLAFFGADGADLPLQSYKLLNVYAIDMGGTVIACCFIGYAVMLGLLGIVLFASSKMRSSIGILALGVALVVVPMFVSNLQNNIANHVLFLFPYLALDPNNLFDMVSYAVGPVVIEYPIVLAMLYSILFVGGALLAARSFSEHQVA